jgi:hypothetical protein
MPTRLLNDITEFVTRADHQDRSIVSKPPTIAEDQRQTESTFWEDFDSHPLEFKGPYMTSSQPALAMRGNRSTWICGVSLEAAAPRLGWQPGVSCRPTLAIA